LVSARFGGITLSSFVPPIVQRSSTFTSAVKVVIYLGANLKFNESNLFANLIKFDDIKLNY
jgi:hypothetical protein